MSRQIPIVVEPGYDDNFRNSRRGSEPVVYPTQSSETVKNADGQFEHPSARFQNRKLTRRYSEDPNTHASKPYNFSASPQASSSFVDPNIFTQRRGSVPVDWGRPHGRRDRFQEIVERMMSADDDELLSGIIEQDFENAGSFGVEEVTEEYRTPEGTSVTHKKINRNPSAPGSFAAGQHSPQKPTVLHFTRDKNGCIEIPVQICKTDEAETSRKEKSEESPQKTAKEKVENTSGGKEESRGENEDVFCNAQHARKDVDTDKEGENADDHVVKISVDATTDDIEAHQKVKGTINEKAPQTTETRTKDSKTPEPSNHNVNAVEEKTETLNLDEKLNNIKKIEKDLEKTHDQIQALKAIDGNEFLILEENLMKYLMALDAVEANGSSKIKEARRTLVVRVQENLNELEKKRV